MDHGASCSFGGEYNCSNTIVDRGSSPRGNHGRQQLALTSRPTKAHMQHAQVQYQPHACLCMRGAVGPGWTNAYYIYVLRTYKQRPTNKNIITYTYYVRTSNDRQTKTELHTRITYVQATTDKQKHNYMYKHKRYTYMYIEANQYVFLSYVHMRVLH